MLNLRKLRQRDASDLSHKQFMARSTDSHPFIFIHSLFHAFDKYILDNFYVPGIVLDAGGEVVGDKALP